MSQLSDLLDAPLCCSHVVMDFKRISAQVRVARSAVDLPILVGMGILSNGDTEPLGAWPTCSAETHWMRIFQDLKRRGVEKFGELHGDTSELADEARSFISPSSGHSPQRIATRVQAALVNATELYRSVCRSIRKQGAFSDVFAASAFAHMALLHAERKVWSPHRAMTRDRGIDRSKATSVMSAANLDAWTSS